MKDLLEYDIPVQERQVNIVYFLKDGQTVMQRDINQYANLFNWLDPNQIKFLIAELKPQTDEHRKSIIAIFETGQIRTFANLSNSFTKYNLLSKTSI